MQEPQQEAEAEKKRAAQVEELEQRLPAEQTKPEAAREGRRGAERPRAEAAPSLLAMEGPKERARAGVPFEDGGLRQGRRHDDAARPSSRTAAEESPDPLCQTRRW